MENKYELTDETIEYGVDKGSLLRVWEELDKRMGEEYGANKYGKEYRLLLSYIKQRLN